MSVDRDLPRGSAAYGVIPAPDAGATAAAYRIGALDVLKVTVFQEEDLSFDELQVDASGNVSLPLIGTVRAEGMTAAALSSERSEERRVGKECVSTCRSRWSPYH